MKPHISRRRKCDSTFDWVVIFDGSTRKPLIERAIRYVNDLNRPQRELDTEILKRLGLRI